jgi:hypothetical protein
MPKFLNAIRHNVIEVSPMICNARDLSPDQKAAIETLLGRRVQEGEAVSVRTFEPVTLSHPRKLEIANELRKYFAEVDASRKPVSEEEAEDIITEAMRSVRPGYSPDQ